MAVTLASMTKTCLGLVAQHSSGAAVRRQALGLAKAS